MQVWVHLCRVTQEAALRVARADIVGMGADRLGFFGSDHCPMVLELAPLFYWAAPDGV